MASPVWFITGVSNGFGRLLSVKALNAGHNVIGTVRSRAKAAEAVQEIEGLKGKIVEMDLTESQSSIAQKVQEAEQIFGLIDILVNNAGYSMMGALESFSEKEITHQYQTNVFGPIYTIQAVLPGMRARKSGLIVNFSSVAGHDALATSGLYASTKFALEGVSETLAKETAEFGISVLIVEPGAFRTNFLQASVPHEQGVPEAYRGSAVDAGIQKFNEMAGKQPGDPEKGIDRIWEVITGEGQAGHLKGKVFRLPLGMDALKRIKGKVDHVQRDLDATWDLAAGTGYE